MKTLKCQIIPISQNKFKRSDNFLHLIATGMQAPQAGQRPPVKRPKQ